MNKANEYFVKNLYNNCTENFFPHSFPRINFPKKDDFQALNNLYINIFGLSYYSELDLFNINRAINNQLW